MRHLRRKLFVLTACLGAIASPRSAPACSPVPALVDHVSCWPAEACWGASLPEARIPVLPVNFDVGFAVVNYRAIDPASVMLEVEGKGQGRKPESIPFTKVGANAKFRLHPSARLPPRTRFQVTAKKGAGRVALLHFKTGEDADKVAPELPEAVEALFVGRFEPAVGSCDTGAPRLWLRVASAKDDRALPEQLRYEVVAREREEIVQPFCGRVELGGFSENLPVDVKITPLDLAGNRGKTQTVRVTSAQTMQPTPDNLKQVASSLCKMDAASAIWSSMIGNAPTTASAAPSQVAPSHPSSVPQQPSKPASGRTWSCAFGPAHDETAAGSLFGLLMVMAWSRRKNSA